MTGRGTGRPSRRNDEPEHDPANRHVGPAHHRDGLGCPARFGQRVAAIVAECNYAQRRLTILEDDSGHVPHHGDQAPDDYAEFLFRTSGALLREPDARHRADGRFVG